MLFAIFALCISTAVSAQTKFMQNMLLLSGDSISINMAEAKVVSRLSNGKAKILISNGSSGTRVLETESSYGSIVTASGGNLIHFVRYNNGDTSSIAINPNMVERIGKSTDNLRTPILLKDRVGTFLVNGTFAATTGSLSLNRGAPTLTAFATLDFASTLATAATDLTITVAGAALGDVVSIGVPNGSVTATAHFFGWVSAANTVKIRFSPKATEDPASGVYKVIVNKI